MGRLPSTEKLDTKKISSLSPKFHRQNSARKWNSHKRFHRCLGQLPSRLCITVSEAFILLPSFIATAWESRFPAFRRHPGLCPLRRLQRSVSKKIRRTKIGLPRRSRHAKRK